MVEISKDTCIDTRVPYSTSTVANRGDCEALLRTCIFVFSVNDDDDSDNDGEEDGKEGDVRD